MGVGGNRRKIIIKDLIVIGRDLIFKYLYIYSLVKIG